MPADFYYETAPGKFALVPEDVRRSNPTLFSPQRLDYLRADLRLKREDAQKNRLNEAAAARERRDFQLRRDQVERGFQLDQTRLGIEQSRTGIQRLEADTARRRVGVEERSVQGTQAIQRGELELARTREENERVRQLRIEAQSDDQFKRSIALKELELYTDKEIRNRQIDDNTRLQERKLGIEEQQFGQEMEYRKNELSVQKKGVLFRYLTDMMAALNR